MGVVVPPHALEFPFGSIKEEGEYWCEVSVRCCLWILTIVEKLKLHPKLYQRRYFTKCSTVIFLSQVNGIDTVRVPVSVEQYEDQSAKYQKQLKTQPRAGTHASATDTTTTVSEDDVAAPSSEGSRSASGAAVNLPTAEEITGPSNESSKKDWRTPNLSDCVELWDNTPAIENSLVWLPLLFFRGVNCTKEDTI